MNRLTITQSAVYDMLTQHRMTVKQIAHRRGTSDKSVYKTMAILKRKGYLSGHFRPYIRVEGTPQPSGVDWGGKFVRVHGQQYLIRIIDSSVEYEFSRRKCDSLMMGDVRVLLHRRSLSVFMRQGFEDKTLEGALEASGDAFLRVLVRLEDRFRVVLLKSKYENIRCVKCHVSEMENEVAIDAEVRDQKIAVKCPVDGKLWLIVDNSFNKHEIESIHPDSWKDDAEQIVAHFNDLRLNPGTMVPSEMQAEIVQLKRFARQSLHAISMLSDGFQGVKKDLDKFMQGFKWDGYDVGLDAPDYFR